MYILLKFTSLFEFHHANLHTTELSYRQAAERPVHYLESDYEAVALLTPSYRRTVSAHNMHLQCTSYPCTELVCRRTLSLYLH